MQLADLVRDYGRTLVESLAGCCFLAATWAASRTKRWLLEHVERERLACEQLLSQQRESEIQRHNETLKTLSEASVNAERPTLESLANNERLDFSLESSEEPFTPPTPMSRRSPSAGRMTIAPPLNRVPVDWSDDEEITTTPETPHSKGSPPNER